VQFCRFWNVFLSFRKVDTSCHPKEVFATHSSLRQSHELAEGQKSADVKRISTMPPPLRPPIDNGGRGLFPEKNASFVDFQTELAEGGTIK
jgi:hypothetical protein